MALKRRGRVDRTQSVEQSILLIRGEKVILDFVLARMYGVPTKVLLQAVRRNAARFPSDFLYQLSLQEVAILRSQFVTSSWGGRRLLALNPDDHQGARSMLVDLRLRKGDNAGALAVCDEFAGDTMPSILYGRVLALFELGRVKDASAALEVAFRLRPRVAPGIAAGEHAPPAGVEQLFITPNSESEAWSYWENAGRAWVRSRKAVAFVKTFVAARAPVAKSSLGRKGKVVPFPRRDRR